MADGDPQAFDPTGGLPLQPETPSPQGVAPVTPPVLPYEPQKQGEPGSPIPYDPMGGLPQTPDQPAPPGTPERRISEKTLAPNEFGFGQMSEQEQKMERTRLNFQDAQLGTVLGALHPYMLKQIADGGGPMADVAKDELQKLKLDILSFKTLPGFQTLGEAYAAMSGQVAGSLLAIENLWNPFLSVRSLGIKAAGNGLLSRIVGYGVPQAAIQGYSDYLSQALQKGAGLREEINPLQVAWAIPTGFVFGTLPAFLKDGKMVRPPEGMRNGNIAPPGTAQKEGLATLSPELTPGIPPVPDRPPPGAFEPGRPPATVQALLPPHPADAMMPPPAPGMTRLYRSDHINDDSADRMFFTKQSFENATQFLDVPDEVVAGATRNDRVELPREMAAARQPLPKPAAAAEARVDPFTEANADPARAEAQQIHDQIAAINDEQAKGFAKGMQTAINSPSLFDESLLPFYRQKLASFKAQAVPGAPLPQETRTLASMLDKKHQNTLASEEAKQWPTKVKSVIADAHEAFANAVKTINRGGLKFGEVNSFNARDKPEVRAAQQQGMSIGGSLSRLLNGIKNKKFGLQHERLDKDIASLRDAINRNYKEGGKPREKGPQTFSEWVKAQGGLKGTEGEIRDLNLPDSIIKPKGKRAKTLDRLLIAAQDQKWLGEHATMDDIVNMLRDEYTQGRPKHYHPGELGQVKAPNAEMIRAQNDVDAMLHEIGLHPSQATDAADKASRVAIRDEAIDQVFRKGKNVDDAVIDAAAREGEHGRGAQGGKFDDNVEIPFDTEATPREVGGAGEAGQAAPGPTSPADSRTSVASVEDRLSNRLKSIEGKTIAGDLQGRPVGGIASANVTENITPVESVQSMMRRISDQLGVLVRKGGISEADAAAQFDFAAEIARVREVGPSGVQRWAHEIGHFVEVRVGAPLTQFLDQNFNSLRAFLGNDIPADWSDAKIKREGFGEFMSAYITKQDALARQDPQFTEAWQNLMDQHAADMMDILNQAATSYQNYFKAPSINAGLGTIKSPLAIPKLDSALQPPPKDPITWLGPVPRMMGSLYTSLLSPFSGRRNFAKDASAMYDVVFNENAALLNYKKLAAQLYRHFGLGDYLPIGPGEKIDVDFTRFFKIWGKGGYQKSVQDMELGIMRFSDMERYNNALGPTLREVVSDYSTGLQPDAKTVVARRDQFDLYLVSRRVKQLYVEQANGRIPMTDRVPSSMTLGDAQHNIDYLNQLYPHWDAKAQEVYRFVKDQVRFEVDARLRTAAEAAELMQPWHSDYVPLMRDTKGMAEAFESTGKISPTGLETLARYTRHGSDLDTLSPIKMIMENMLHINDQGIENNTVGLIRDLIKLFDGKADKWLGEEIPNTRIRSIDIEVQEALFRAAKQAGFATEDARIFARRGVQEFGEDVRVQMYRKESITKGNKPILFGWDGDTGSRYAIQLPSTDLGRAFVNVMDSMGPKGVRMHGQAINLMSDVMGLGTGTYRTLTTGMLTYQLKSSVMDSFIQWMTIPEVGTFKGFPLFLSSLRTGIAEHYRATHGAGGPDNMWRMWQSAEGFGGGAAHQMMKRGHGGLVELERELKIGGVSPWREQRIRMDAARAEQARLGNELADIGIEQHRGLITSRIQDVVGWMEKTEAWGRTGAMRAIYDANIEAGHGHKYAMIDAAEKAIDITNYRQHGSGMEAFSRIIPFFSSALTGLEKFVRTYKMILPTTVSTVAEREYQSQMRRALLPRLGAVAVIAGGIQAWMRDDPAYQRISPETKAKYFIFRLPFVPPGLYDSVNGAKVDLPQGLQGPWIFIPKPWEQGTVANLAEHVVEFFMSGGDTREIGKFIKSMTYTFNLPNPFEPPFLKTINALKSGIDPYTGRPVVTASRQNLPPHLQSSDYTYSFYKAVAAGLNLVWDSGDARKWLHENIPIIGAALAAPWSPMEAQYLFQGMLGDFPREFGGFYNVMRGLATLNPSSIKAEDIPMLRAFVRSSVAMGQPMQDLYNQIKQNNGRLTMAKAGFDFYKNGGDMSAATTYFNSLDEQQKEYVRIHEAQAGPLANVLHPMDRASALASSVRTLKDGLQMPNGIATLANPNIRIKLDPNKLDIVNRILNEYETTEVRNSLIVQGVKGYERLPVKNTQPYFDMLRAVSPEVAQELSGRLAQHKVFTIEALQRYWDPTKKILAAGGGANPYQYQSQISGMAYQASTLGYEGGGKRVGRSAIDSAGNVIKQRKKTEPVLLP